MARGGLLLQMDPIPSSPVVLLHSSEANQGSFLRHQGLQEAASSHRLTQQGLEHFICCQGKGPSSQEVSICQALALPLCTEVHAGREAGETHLKASQHLESSCWPACYALCSTGPVGMQIGRDKVRKRREDRDLQKSWLYAHGFVLPSMVLPGLPFSALAA